MAWGEEVDNKFNSCILVISEPWVIKHTLVLLAIFHRGCTSDTEHGCCILEHPACDPWAFWGGGGHPPTVGLTVFYQANARGEPERWQS